MDAKDCNRYDSCSAPHCPMDEWNLGRGIWYPDEEICQLQAFCKLGWIRLQKKIARKCRDTDGFFKLEMLERDCIISVAIKGIDPDDEYCTTEELTRQWLNNHPSKRIKSESEKEILKNRLLDYKKGLTLSKKDQSAEQNRNFESVSSRKLLPNYKK